MQNKHGRMRIERAALELFASEGIASSSTREIARRAGLAEGTLYRHFRTKENLAMAMFVDLSRRLTQAIEEAAARALTPPARIGAIIDAFFRFAEEQPAAFEYITQSHPRLGALPRELRLPKDVVLEVVRHGVEEGAFRGDPKLGMVLVIGMILKTIFFLQGGFFDAPADAVKDGVVEAALRVLGGAP